MKRRKTVKRAVPDAAKGAGTPLSTRFTEQETRVLKQAANARGWSVAQLIRAGALELAASTLNAGKSGAQMGRFLVKFLRDVVNPEVEVRSDDPESTEVTRWRLQEYLRGLSQECDSPVTLVTPDVNAWRRFARSARLLGSEFAAYLERAIPIPSRSNMFEGLIDPRQTAYPGASDANAPARKGRRRAPVEGESDA